MKVKRISHIAFLVSDLEAARSQFSNLLGIEFEGRVESKENDTRGYMSSIGIELVSPLTSDGPVARTLQRRGEGFVMLALDVPDIDEAINDMQSAGVRKVGEGQGALGRMATFHPRDFHGVMLEMIQRT